MGFKDLFIKSDGNEEEKPSKPVREESISFPSSDKTTRTEFPKAETPKSEKITFPKASAPSSENTIFDEEDESTKSYVNEISPIIKTVSKENKFIKEISDVYEQVFAQLNMDGVDFYEFFQNVSAIDINNPQVYQMAYTMLKTMDATVTKEKFISTAQYYIDELNKSHDGYRESGLGKKEALTGQKQNEKVSLDTEILDLETRVIQLQQELEEKKREASTIDEKYKTELYKIDGKLEAIDVVRDNIIGKIQTVINNLEINVK